VHVHERVGIERLRDRVDAIVQLPRAREIVRLDCSEERALKIRESRETDPAKRAETRFALARALWETRRDRPRSYRLAEDARDAYLKSSAKGAVTGVEDWLRDHGLSATYKTVPSPMPRHGGQIDSRSAG